MPDFFLKEEELDNFQTQLIQRNVNHSMIVSGCAGSGKSLIALWKAKQINDLGKSFYFVVYTKVLKKYFNDGIRLINDPALEGMRKMINDENKFFYYDRWNGSIANVEYMIVDEAQDFDRDDIQRLKNAAQKAVYFFGDTAQSIYRFRRNTIPMGEIARIVGLESPEQLMQNYRLPKKVARVAEALCSSNDLTWRCVKEGEHLPEKLLCADDNDQLDRIVEIIDTQKLTNVGILFSNNLKVKNAYEYFRRKGLSVEAKYDENQTTHLDLDFGSDNPKLMTYHSSKGLQFETVFLPNPTLFERDQNPYTPLYVAMTRTSDRLYLLFSVIQPTFLDSIPENLFKNDEDIFQL